MIAIAVGGLSFLRGQEEAEATSASDAGSCQERLALLEQARIEGDMRAVGDTVKQISARLRSPQ